MPFQPDSGPQSGFVPDKPSPTPSGLTQLQAVLEPAQAALMEPYKVITSDSLSDVPDSPYKPYDERVSEIQKSKQQALQNSLPPDKAAIVNRVMSQDMKPDMDKFLSAAGGATAAGAMSKLPGMAAQGLKGYFSRIAGNGALGAASDKENPLRGAAIGGGLTAVAEPVASGIGSVADYSMQKAAGLKKYLKGVGNSLVDQGVWGTKSGMLDQVSSKLPEVESQVQDLAKTAGPIDSKEVAKRIMERASMNNRVTPSGLSTSGSSSDIDSILERAAEVEGRGSVSPADALSFARGAERNAYKLAPGEVRPGLNPELGQAEGRAYKGLLTDQVPGLQDKLSDEQALVLAKRGLGAAPPVRQGAPLTTLFGAGVGAAAGAAASPGDRLKGAAKGAALATVARSPLVQSLFAKGLQQGIQPLTSGVSDPEIQQALIQLLNPVNKSEK